MKASNFFQPEMVALLKDIQGANRQRAEDKINNGLSLNIYGKKGITSLFWLVAKKNKPAIKVRQQLIEYSVNLPFSSPK